jgi:acyl carrier protein phosphodiesterase
VNVAGERPHHLALGHAVAAMDSGTAYKIVVRGELDDRYAYLFDGMHMHRVDGTTVLTGNVTDQSQLHGLLDRLEELALELLSVQQLRRHSRGDP